MKIEHHHNVPNLDHRSAPSRPGRAGLVARPLEFVEQTEKVLAEFGFGSDEIAELPQHKVV